MGSQYSYSGGSDWSACMAAFKPATTAAFDATATSITTVINNTITITWTHTCTGSTLLLVLSAAIWQDVAGTGTITSASYNGVALTNIQAVTQTQMRSELWYLKAPASGSHALPASSETACVMASSG